MWASLTFLHSALPLTSSQAASIHLRNTVLVLLKRIQESMLPVPEEGFRRLLLLMTSHHEVGLYCEEKDGISLGALVDFLVVLRYHSHRQVDSFVSCFVPP